MSHQNVSTQLNESLLKLIIDFYLYMKINVSFSYDSISCFRATLAKPGASVALVMQVWQLEIKALQWSVKGRMQYPCCTD